jgi:hypothetical protein
MIHEFPNDSTQFTRDFAAPGKYILLATVTADADLVKTDYPPYEHAYFVVGDPIVDNRDFALWEICTGDPQVDWCGCHFIQAFICKDACPPGDNCTVENLGMQCADAQVAIDQGVHLRSPVDCPDGPTLHMEHCECETLSAIRARASRIRLSVRSLPARSSLSSSRGGSSPPSRS